MPGDPKSAPQSRIVLWLAMAGALPIACLCCGGAGVGTYFLVTHQGKSGSAAGDSTVAAQPPPKGNEFVNSIGMKFVRIEAGNFTMGSPATEDGRNPDETEHEIEITRPFYLGRYEVTQAQYGAVMGNNPSKAQGDTLPVEQVSWDDAKAFCSRLSQKDGREYTLPTEAEWEYACRAGTRTAYAFGNTLAETQAAIKKGTRPIGSFAPNPWGLYDMHGNVNEWCEDYYDGKYYARSARRDPRGPANGKERIVRGGAWCTIPGSWRAAYRGGYRPTYKNDGIGFRVVLRTDNQ